MGWAQMRQPETRIACEYFAVLGFVWSIRPAVHNANKSEYEHVASFELLDQVISPNHLWVCSARWWTRILGQIHPAIKISRGGQVRLQPQLFYGNAVHTIRKHNDISVSQFIPINHHQASKMRGIEGSALSNIVKMSSKVWICPASITDGEITAPSVRSFHNIGAVVLSMTPPQQNSNYGVGNSGHNTYELKALPPPLGGFIACICGVFGGLWGWVNLRERRLVEFSGPVLIASIGMWIYGLFIVLPWLAVTF